MASYGVTTRANDGIVAMALAMVKKAMANYGICHRLPSTRDYGKLWLRDITGETRAKFLN